MRLQRVQILKRSRDPMFDLPTLPPNTLPNRNENRGYRSARVFLPEICRLLKISHSLHPKRPPKFGLFYCPEFEPNARSLPAEPKILRENPSANILHAKIARCVSARNRRLRFQTNRRRSSAERSKAFLPTCRAPGS